MKNIVIKIGGSLAVDFQKLSEFVKAVSLLKTQGYNIALVHGGGKEINANLALLKETPQFIDGMRVTTPSIMNMVEMTLSGLVNKKIVRLFLDNNVKAIGISGVDASLFKVVKRKGNVDLGLVGEIQEVEEQLIFDLWKASYLPVISPVSYGNGLSWNVNADTAASKLATALKADAFVLVSDVPGVLDLENNVIPELSKEKAETLIQEGVISGGMIPKVRESFDSIEKGISSIHIVGFKDTETFCKQIQGKENGGTILK